MNIPNYTTYPMAYPQPMYANNFTQQPNKMPTISYGMNWVNGIEGAKAVQLPINTTAPFFDSEQNTLYIKTSDNIGMSTMKIFDLVERKENKQTPTSNIDLFITPFSSSKIRRFEIFLAISITLFILSV